MDAVVFVARDLLHLESGRDDPDVDEGLDLETGAVEGDLVEAVTPEGVVAVAEVGVPGAELAVDERAEGPVAQSANGRHVVRAAAVGESGALGEIRTADEGGDVRDDLLAVGRAVRVDHDDDVAGAGREAADQRVALALADLLDHLDVRPQFTGDVHRVVRGISVDEHDFVNPFRQCLEHVRKIFGFVHRGNDNTHRRSDRQM